MRAGIAAMLAGAMAMSGVGAPPPGVLPPPRPPRREPTPDEPKVRDRRLGRMVNSGGNAMQRQSFRGYIFDHSGPPVPANGADLKRELIELARRAGWKGKSYRKALRFERKLTRLEKAGAR